VLELTREKMDRRVTVAAREIVMNDHTEANDREIWLSVMIGNVVSSEINNSS
jgi:hypothetical protein